MILLPFLGYLKQVGVPHMAATHPDHSLVQAVWPLDLRVSPQVPCLPCP